jgi:tripartite-type tricarboxylate transporter receptor subunit TctC
MGQVGFLCNMKFGQSISDNDTMKLVSRTSVASPRRVFSLSLLCGLINLGLPQIANAQEAKPLTNKKFRLVVPFSPGGGVDGLARAVAENLTRNAGAAVIVENKPGAGGNIAAVQVAKSPVSASGELQLLVTSVNHYANPVMVRNSGYDAYKDFVPVAYLCTFPYAFIVPGESKYNTLPEYLAAARTSPNTLSWAFGGNGSLGHFLGVAMEQSAKIKGVPVAYKGGPDLLAALASKQVDMAIMSVQSSTPLVKQGRLKSLAVAGHVRNKVTPDVPGVNEVLPTYPNIVGFVALYAPANTPPALLAQLHAEMNKVLVSDEYKKRLDSDGSTASIFPNLEALKVFFEKDGQQWEALTRSTGLKVE